MERVDLRRQAVTIVVTYAAAGALWIALSDLLVAALVDDEALLVQAGVYKGFAFVVGTAALLHVLLRRTVRTVERTFAAIDEKEAERRLHEAARRRADAIVESTDDAIVSHTVDGIITSWNPAAERLLGHRAEEILGRSTRVLVPDDRADEASSILERLQRGEHIEQLETTRVRRDGTRLHAAVTYSPILGDDAGARGGEQKLAGVSMILRDISQRMQAEEAAEKERDFAMSLVEAMPGSFYLYDDEGRFLRWNRDFERVTGYSGAELAQMHPTDFFAGDDKQLVQQRIAQVFEQGASSVEATLVAKDGTGTPYFFTGKRIVFDGKACLLGVGLDISERKKTEAALKKSEERYRTTLDNILEGCQLLDFDWRYLYLNDAAATQNRRPNAELLGNRMPDVWPGIEGSSVFALLSRCMQERRAVHGEIEFAFPDGATGWFDVRSQPVPEGVFVLSIDISERKEAEQALHELNDSLERRVAERTFDLEAARERAEAADRTKSAFLATMSHELRTPLNSIIGFTGIVRQGMAGPVNDEQSKQLGMVQASARHLLDLINDVLDISKIEAGQLEVRCAPFDLCASMERVAASVQPHAVSGGLALRVTLPELGGPMESDQRRVEQILLNLLNNAIKFTERGEVSLTAELVSPPGDGGPAVRIQVADTGIGMKASDISRLFQPFRQLDSGLQRAHEGTGLGLAICRRLTELLGGTIAAESVLGEGSVFSVVLPMKPSVTR